MAEEIIDVSNSINYQEGSIISREIIKKPTGNITLFAFSKGQGLSEHSAPFDALVYIVDGLAEIKISGEAHTVSKNQMIILPANKPHELKAIDNLKMILTMIKS